MSLIAAQNKTITIKTLVDNTAKVSFQSEHGLSFWIEYGDKRAIFDTGQSDIIVKNATLLKATWRQQTQSY